MDSSRFTSGTLMRILPWVGALVLAAGTTVFLLSLRSDSPSTPLPPSPATSPQAPGATSDGKPKKVSPEVQRVAGEFILTAVARKNLDASWPLTHPTLRSGYTRAQWRKGNLPIVPFPVNRLEQARFKVDEVYKNQVMMEVALIPGPKAKIDAAVFFIGLKATGVGTNRRWQVDYWMPRWNVPVPDAPG